jgi:hypothetical protein
VFGAKAVAKRFGQAKDIGVGDLNRASGRSRDACDQIEERGFSGAASAAENGAAARWQGELLDVDNPESRALTKRKNLFHATQNESRLRVHHGDQLKSERHLADDH